MHTRYLEPAAHVTNTQPYARYRKVFEKGESPVPLHWHLEAELLYLVQGEMLLRVENEQFLLRTGDALFIPPQLLHNSQGGCGEAGYFRALVFSTDMVAQRHETARYERYVLPAMHGKPQCCLHLHADNADHRGVLADLTRLFSACDDGGDNELMVQGLVQVIWQQICLLQPLMHQELQPSGRGMEIFRAVAEYIQLHYAEDLTLDMLAACVHVSGSQLCRSFRRATGSTVFAYLNRYRIMKSCALLQETNKKISEISGLCGFNNISYFNREFLRVTRLTPSGYRRACRKE